VIVTDTDGVTHVVAPVRQTFYWAPAPDDVKRGLGLASVSFLDANKEVLAGRELPPF
jgi:hypothetical protein